MNVYIKAQESVCLVHPEIKIKDIMSLYCTDKDLEQKIKNQSVYHFIGDNDQRKCFSILMLVEVIKQVDKTLDVINLPNCSALVRIVSRLMNKSPDRRSPSQ